MCVAIPGEVLEIKNSGPFMQGLVSFGGIKKEVSLACTPEVKIGDFVLVHVGIAISIIDRMEAERIFQQIDEINSLEE